MQDRSKRYEQGLPWVKMLVIGLIVIGVGLRFVNLDRKVYWYDETMTSLRVFGYTRTELQQAFQGQVVRVAELQKYQHPSPDRGWDDTLNALLGSSEHPPLYYLLARLWAIGGSSIAAMRSLPAVISLLAFPAIYWLCRELFDSTLTGWVAMGLVAVAPFHVLYAQEAREYSLWVVAIVVSSAAFLRSLRLQTRGSWALYAATVALGLYTHILGGVVPLAHGLFLWCDRQRKPLVPFLLSVAAGLLAFAPWIWVIFTSLEKIDSATANVREHVKLSNLIDRWLTNLNRAFLDIDLGSIGWEDFNWLWLGLVIFVLCWLRRKDPVASTFILTLIGVNILPLVLPDLILGGRRSFSLRYLMPCYLAIQITIAHFLATQLAGTRWHPKVGRTALVSLTLAGVLSGVISSQAQVWWVKSVERTESHPSIARIVNSAKAPLVISDSRRATGTLSISRLFDDHVSLQLLPVFDNQRVPDGFSDVFVLDGSPAYFRSVSRQQSYNAARLFQLPTKTFTLWRLQKRSA